MKTVTVFAQFTAGLLGAALLVAPVVGAGTFALVATATSAFAANNPIPGIDIITRKEHAGHAMRVQTGADGGFTLPRLTAGAWDLDMDGTSLRKALSKLGAKGPKAMISITIGIPGQTPVVANRQEVEWGGNAGIRTTFTLPAGAKEQDYKGTVVWVK